MDLILKIEGGYVNDPKDPGGETKYGISKRAFPKEDILNLTEQRAKELYKKFYWDFCKCEELPYPLDIFLFDAAVNHGVIGAVRILQEALELKPDGILGEITISTIKKNGQDAALKFLAQRALFYTELDNFKRYGKGWFNRLFKIALKS